MKFRQVLPSLLRMSTVAQAVLALHVTSSSLSSYRSRAASGPFKTTSDVKANSPGDWTRILANATSWHSNPSNYRWSGPTYVEAVTLNGHTYRQAVVNGRSTPTPTWDQVYADNEPTLVNSLGGTHATGYHVRDAAFYLMVNWPNMTTSERDGYITRLYADFDYFAARPRLQLGDDTPENRAKEAAGGSFYVNWPNTRYRDLNPLFLVQNWQTNLLFAVSYLKVALEEMGIGFDSTKWNTYRSWHVKSAYFGQVENNDWDINRNFTNRMSLPDTALYTLSDPTRSISTRGGFPLCCYMDTQGTRQHLLRGTMQTFNNRRMVLARYATLVGLFYGEADLVARGKRYVKDWLKYGCYQGLVNGNYVGTVPADMERWASNPNIGWGYASDVTASAASIAYHLALAGDMDLISYSTRQGVHQEEGYLGTVAPEPGPAKSILGAKQFLAGIIKGSFIVYGTNTPANLTNAYRITSVNPYATPGTTTPPSWNAQHDMAVMIGNELDKDTSVRDLYMRNGTLYGIWANPETNGRMNAYMGDWGIYPGIHFQFGLKE